MSGNRRLDKNNTSVEEWGSSHVLIPARNDDQQHGKCGGIQHSVAKPDGHFAQLRGHWVYPVATRRHELLLRIATGFGSSALLTLGARLYTVEVGAGEPLAGFVRPGGASYAWPVPGAA